MDNFYYRFYQGLRIDVFRGNGTIIDKLAKMYQDYFDTYLEPPHYILLSPKDYSRLIFDLAPPHAVRPRFPEYIYRMKILLCKNLGEPRIIHSHGEFGVLYAEEEMNINSRYITACRQKIIDDLSEQNNNNPKKG